MKKDVYRKSLNLPRTNFSMRANLVQKEPQILKFWEENRVYERLLRIREGNPPFHLHDGPPYANGDIHVGHVLNKVLKDIVVRSRSMMGYYAPFVPGWDTHGLPTEQAVEREDGKRRNEMDVVKWRKLCKKKAEKYVKRQMEQFKRLGVFALWNRAYITFQKEYEASELRVLGEIASKGYLYRQKKPVYWCPSCETALAEAELEYAELPSPSIYVKFPVKGREDEFVVIWTTTPWTLPANVALAVGPDYSYRWFIVGEERWLGEEEGMKRLLDSLGVEYEAGEVVKGKELEGLKTVHPFVDRESPVILADFVTLDEGTGVVHIAPGHGAEDFEVGRKYGLPVVSPLDERGVFTEEAPEWLRGMRYDEGNSLVLEELRKRGVLVKEETITHSYPTCWRCKNPVIFRAAEQWFLEVDKIREYALKSAASIRWIPSWGEERMLNMLKERPDWCLTRQRPWGVPFAVFYCKKCGKPYFTPETFEKVARIVEEKGSDAWFYTDVKDLLPENAECECGSKEFEKESDILDVWFDSGVSHFAVMKERLGVWPVDLYLEGNDQYRGWFQTSLLTSVALTGKPHVKEVLTHGFVVDAEGRKMSKSLGNVVAPQEVWNKYGAEILRMWAVYGDFKGEVKSYPELFDVIATNYRKIRNTIRFLLSNLYDFGEEEFNSVDEKKDLREIDRWALVQLNALVEKVLKRYENYEFHLAYRELYNFCVESSNFYLDVVKDRLYVEHPNSKLRRSVQYVFAHYLKTLTLLMAPILVFTSEDAWQHFPHFLKNYDSVHLEKFPEVNPDWVNDALKRKWETILEARKLVYAQMETMVQEGKLENFLEAAVEVYATGNYYEVLSSFSPQELREIFNVSEVDVFPIEQYEDFDLDVKKGDLQLVVVLKEGERKKCRRCWLRRETVGEDPDYPDVCLRCADVLKKLKEDNLWGVES